jgi:hypothetical protein
LQKKFLAWFDWCVRLKRPLYSAKRSFRRLGFERIRIGLFLGYDPPQSGAHFVFPYSWKNLLSCPRHVKYFLLRKKFLLRSRVAVASLKAVSFFFFLVSFCAAHNTTS